MAKRRREDDLLRDLMRRDPPADAATVTAGLSHAKLPIVEAAAEAAGRLPAHEIGTPVLERLDALLDGGADPGARIKTTLVNVLRQLQLDHRPLVRRALWCEQVEFDGDGLFDVGGNVRAAACYATVEAGDPAAAMLLAGVLFEQPPPRVKRNPAARIAAAKGLAVAGDPDAVFPLELKLRRAGPDQPDVIGECVASLLQLADWQVQSWLETALRQHGAEAIEACVVPVAEQRRPEGTAVLTLLRRQLATLGDEPAAMLGFALVRQPEATDLLIEALLDAPHDVAVASARALFLLRHDAGVIERVERALDASAHATLLRRTFEGG